MKAELIRIGNSQGIRIPKAIIKQCGFGKAVQLTVRDNDLIVSPGKVARQDWDVAFEAMSKHGDDALICAEIAQNVWDHTEWEW